ncbi:MAG: hypothetical protein C4576_16470 [Desulfobacteraceae bacterium]|nr:MAG: hypothetical protein C4576_16470 [Desulfobacteraceae bacterium]
MQVIDRARDYGFLGREFLVWLWYKSQTNQGRFSLGEAGEGELWFDCRVVLQSEEEGTEKVICMGEKSNLREARFALAEYKSVTEAMLKLIIGDDEWSFTLDSTWMNFRSFKTPKVVQDNDKDPEGLFYEKFQLIEKALSAMDFIYASFIKIRLSPEWSSEELPALVKWIKKGK